MVWQLHLMGCHSLKEKRRVVRSLKDRLASRYKVSAAEVDHQDSWQRAALAVSLVTTDRQHAEAVLSSCDRLVCGEAEAQVLASEASFH
jgi:uncharacterized protein YlxP (DUF503 family)